MKSRVAALLWFAACTPDADTVSSSAQVEAAAPANVSTQLARAPRSAIVTGGTLLVLSDGKRIVAADPDRDALDFVSADDETRGDVHTTGSLQLPQGSEPARLALDGNGLLYVVLRGTSEIARVDPSVPTLLSHTHVCAEPRGLAWDASAQRMRVACAEGVMATVDPSDGSVTTERWPVDLRDPLPMPDGTLTATTLRNPRRVNAAGVETPLWPRVTVPTDSGNDVTFSPTVAARSVVTPDGTIISVHQRSLDNPTGELLSLPMSTTTGVACCAHQYSGVSVGKCAENDLEGINITVPVTSTVAACPTPVVRPTLTVARLDGTIGSINLPGTAPVDLAVSPNGQEIAVALAGSAGVVVVPLSSVTAVSGSKCASALPMLSTGGIPSGVAYKADGTLIVQTLSPNRVVVRVAGTGNVYGVVFSTALTPARSFFYTAPSGLACASCHPEGRDDGHTWVADGMRHRTLSLTGGLLATAPFHWDGNLPTLSSVVQFTFVGRMGGQMPPAPVVEALGHWLDELPGPAPVGTATPEVVGQGRALFSSAGCVGCHRGTTLTNNQTMDVGTGEALQVPSLRGVGAHGPWLHDGRAATLHDRFTAMGGGDNHGNTSWMSEDQLTSLIAYLETL